MPANPVVEVVGIASWGSVVGSYAIKNAEAHVGKYMHVVDIMYAYINKEMDTYIKKNIERKKMVDTTIQSLS